MRNLMSKMTKSSGKKKSLRASYPTRLDVPILILIACALLWQGLTLPLVYVEKMAFWKSSYSVYTGILSLMEQKEYFLSVILFFFSFIFPIVKLFALLYIWFIRLADHQREVILHWLGILGKWSMLDVFVVAILIVLVKLGPLAHVEPRQGVYFFCLAIITSMLTTMRVEHLARGAASPKKALSA